MKIKKLSIKGYRSLKDVTWESGDLNVLIGPNASGKSNFLRGMELLRLGATGDLDDAILHQGGFGAILWSNDPSGEIEWRLDLENQPTKPLTPPPSLQLLSYELELKPVGTAGYRVEREVFRGYRDAAKNGGFKYLERDQKEAILFDSGGKRIEASQDRLETTQTILRQTSKVFSGPEMFFLYTRLKGWGVYQDLNVYQDSPVRRAAVTRREMQLAPNGANLITFLHTLYTGNRSFKADLNDAMRAAFGREFEGLEFTPAEDQRVQMRLEWKSFKTAHSAADLSDGTLRFLMLLGVLLNRASGDLVAIDEPETGLHPSMFPVIAELAAEASRSSQIIFSTHSPEFLSALGHHNPKTTVVQSMEGETKLTVLNGDDLKKWLEKYTLGELFVSGGAEALA